MRVGDRAGVACVGLWDAVGERCSVPSVVMWLAEGVGMHCRSG